MRRNHLKQHSPRFLAVVAKSKQSIHELSPRALKEKLDHKEPLCLIDVREESEWASSGHIPTAIFMSKGIIERDIEKKFPDPTTQLVVYCSGGFRCALVADTLQHMGYTNVHSLNTGLQGWIDEGFDTENNEVGIEP